MSYLINKFKKKKATNLLKIDHNGSNQQLRGSDIGQPFMVKHNIHVNYNPGILLIFICINDHLMIFFN